MSSDSVTRRLLLTMNLLCRMYRTGLMFTDSCRLGEQVTSSLLHAKGGGFMRSELYTSFTIMVWSPGIVDCTFICCVLTFMCL